MTSQILKQGYSHPAFTQVAKNSFPLFNIELNTFKHNELQFTYHHFASNDTNNVFGVMLKTLPSNDKGIPHILEHLALCGSEKYPVRDPFFNMLKRSLNTFMNAFTCPDLTCYPYSTQNEQDYYNLMGIYLDATFRPKLRKQDFMQEGWRLDYNKDKGLEFKGVVFNEMKGVYQSTSQLFSDYAMNSLYDSENTYSKMYGGNPADIPKLEYDELKQFHEKHYHPSNSKIFTYGNLNPEKHMETLDQYFKGFTEQKGNFPIANSKKVNKTVYVNVPSDSMAVNKEKQTKFALNYLCNEIQDVQESMNLQILSGLLFSEPSGILYKSIIEKQIAGGYSPSSGYSIYQKQGMLSLGVEQIGQNDVENVEKIIKDSIRDVVQNGFDQKEIDAIIHQIEIKNKMPKTNFGISLMFSQVFNINHDVDMKEALDLDKLINYVKQHKNNRLFENLAQKYILDNEHCVKLIMNPNDQDNFQTQQEKIEKEQLQSYEKNLNEQKIQEIQDINLKLKNAQDKKDENIDLLPTLTIDNIQKENEKIPFIVKKVNNCDTYFYNQNTNGLTFLRIKISSNNIDDQKYSSLVSNLFNCIGTKKTPLQEFQQKLSRYTTNFSLSHNSSQNSKDGCENFYLLNIACLDHNIDNMFELVKEIFDQPNFDDHDTIVNQLNQIGVGISDSVQNSPLNYAMNYAQSGIKESSETKNMIHNARFMNELSKNIQEKQIIQSVIDNLKSISEQFKFQDRLSFSFHSNESNFNVLEQKVQQFISNIPEKNNSTYQRQLFVPKMHETLFELPLQVSFATESLEIPHFQEIDSAKFTILSKIYSNLTLHKEIREKGGAYGSGCRYSSEGLLTFFSYRDPNPMNSYKVFYNVLNQKIEASQKDLDEAKLSVFQSQDSLVPPQNKGLQHFIKGTTWEELQQFRTEILETDIQELVRIQKQYLIGQPSSKVLFSGDTKSFSNWNIQKVINE